MILSALTKAAVLATVLAMAGPPHGGDGSLLLVAAADGNENTTTKAGSSATTTAAAASGDRSNHPIHDKIHSERRFMLYHSRSLEEGSCRKLLLRTCLLQVEHRWNIFMHGSFSVAAVFVFLVFRCRQLRSPF